MDSEWQEAISTSTTTSTTKITVDEKKPTEQSNNKKNELIQQEQQSQQQKVELITSRHHPIFNNNNNNNNNIQHVAPVGVLIVLFTLYITATALQRNYINQNSNNNGNSIKDANNVPEESQSKWLLEQKRQESIMNRLMEHDHVCMDLEVFTKSIDDDDYDVHDEWLDEMPELTNNVNEEHLEVEVDNLALQDHHNLNSNDLNGKQLVQRRRSLKRKYGHRNGANGGHHHHRHHHNRSVNKLSKTAEKKTEALKKEPKEPKKSTTAEPIIYLFALVFIYLLLKAASDINQHYKSQSKGDKRLRRCSLQSYAQTHKQDRRASKDSPIRQRQRLMEFRSISVDRYNSTAIATSTAASTDISSDYAEKKAEILANLRKYSSMETSHFPPVASNNIVEPGGVTILNLNSGSSTELLPTLNRRCSVPISMNYHKQKLTGMPLAPIVNTSRRTSIAMGNMSQGITSSMEHFELHMPETRRRVRMINRH